ncbi:lipopolysaccharide biosynthesis protein [Nocardioides sp. W7]|uniref:lipopolysaccharide biosynthesis protein n=1 Tax=Nocardioides sp. W7 TaxID=2931390 RepID=UPI001FD51E50|nr:lipopolysaccharide biosynthesis protein [Nocardioides sp. W7]
MSDTLQRGVRGASVTLGGQGALLLIQLAGTIALSRLLSPDDFGLFALVLVFMAFGELLRDMGMPAAALQAKSLSHQQASNIFWVSAALSTAAGVALVVATPLLVGIYDEPRLSLVAPTMALVLLVSGLQAQYQVRLARAMRFTDIVIANVVARLAGLCIGIVGAVAGLSYWALVLQAVGSAVLSLLLLLFMARWLPSRPRRNSGSRELLRAGGHLGGAQLLGYAADNVDTLVIGWHFGPSVLGFYNRAFQLFMAPLNTAFNPLVRVIVPTVNRAVEEGKRASQILLRVQLGLCGLVIWVLLVTATTAPWLVPALLGEQWSNVVTLLQILAIGGAFRALSQTNYWTYLVENQSKELLLSNAISKPLQIVLVFGAAFVSVEAVAWAYAIGRALTWPFNLVWMLRISRDYSWQFGLNGARLLLAAGGSFAASSWVLDQSALTALAAIGLGTLLSTVIFGLLLVLAPGGRRELAGVASIAQALRTRATSPVVEP